MKIHIKEIKFSNLLRNTDHSEVQYKAIHLLPFVKISEWRIVKDLLYVPGDAYLYRLSSFFRLGNWQIQFGWLCWVWRIEITNFRNMYNLED